MDYIEEILTSSNVIAVKVSGTIDTKKLADLGKQARKRAHENGLKFLLDLTEAKGFPSIVELHNWFKDYYDDLERHLKWVPTAHVCPPSAHELCNFIETSWTNRGANVRAFTDRKTALEWLIGK